MHSDQAAVQKSVRGYMMVFGMLMVFTIITVGVAQLHFAVPMAIAVALVIAGMKGAMVAAVFMHLSHERWWVYGTLLLTVVFFIVLLFLPVLTTLDGIGIGSPWLSGEAGGR
jgi:cytochrome c oxidase subunit 4